MNDLDQFYTQPLIAELCMAFLTRCLRTHRTRYIFMEPSAGDGSFYKLLPKDRRLGIDLDPKTPGLVKLDFFHFKYVGTRRVIVVGNPPFGKNSSMAVKFFNHAAWLPEVDFIAFIVPKTFRKVSIQNRLSMDFHLIGELDLPDESFLKDGKPYKVPCVFQVWKRLSTPRKPTVVDLNNDWFDFVNKNDNPNIAVRRVGWKAGMPFSPVGCKEHSFYFLRVKYGINIVNFGAHLIELHHKGCFNTVVSNTAGPRSLSKGEFLEILRENPFPI